MMNKKKLAGIYVLVDWLASILAWTLFYLFRKTHEDLYINYWDRISYSLGTTSFWLGVIFIPIGWVMKKVCPSSRRRDLKYTFS